MLLSPRDCLSDDSQLSLAQVPMSLLFGITFSLLRSHGVFGLLHLSSSGLSVCQKFSPMEPESIFVMVGLGGPQKNTFACHSEGLKP